ncbi:MAG: segregation/condensation protein A, partial [Clostridia bacterium]
MAEFESIVDYSTKLDNFEGPLDLLLHLIKEAKIEIKDIFVSEVTEQFLQYMNNLEVLDVDKASEYLNMAATLLEIKSKSILPRIEEFTDDIEDPEQALIRQLEEYKLFKEASE